MCYLCTIKANKVKSANFIYVLIILATINNININILIIILTH